MGFEGEAQSRRRRLGAAIQRPEERDPRRAAFGRDRQAPQMVVAWAADPGDEGVAASRAQHLLGGPQRIALSSRAHHRELREIDARGCQRRRIREVRRSKPDHALSGPCKRRQRRKDERELADALMRAKELGEHPGRPSSAGQGLIQIGVMA